MNLNQVTVAVSNIENSIAFYQKLGLHLIVKSPHYARFECPEGDATFSIHLDTNSNSSTYIYFEVENVNIKVEELINKGIQFDELAEDKNWLWREAQLRDLDNNIIIIFHAGDNRKNPPWRIN